MVALTFLIFLEARKKKEKQQKGEIIKLITVLLCRMLNKYCSLVKINGKKYILTKTIDFQLNNLFKKKLFNFFSSCFEGVYFFDVLK